MSLTGAMVSGILGLQAQAQAMGAISDNISNVNTVGYKRAGMQFSTLVTDEPTASSYAAGGVQARPRQFVSSQGVLAASASPTDLAIQGNGFLVVSSRPVAGPSNGGPAAAVNGATIGYTRAGNFTVDANGNLRNAAGYYLQGWPAIPPANTSFATSQTVQQLRTVNVAGLSGNATATTSLAARVNLQASTPASAGYVFGSMGTYLNSGGATGTAPDFQRTFQIHDSQGTARGVTVAFKKIAANQWTAEAYADISGSGTQTLLNSSSSRANASSLVAFKANGTLDTAASTFLGNNSPLAINWAPALGVASPQNLTLNFGSDGLADGFTQLSSPSTLVGSTIDGAASGTFTGVTIDNQGIVQALFDNGTRRNIYQVPLVTFTNPDGLKAGTGNVYQESSGSGAGHINAAGFGGSGQIQANRLEQANVDLATEFTNMVTVQRAYSANSKTIQTVNDMLNEIINLKR